ncbi:hypothetical protein [Algoriphagus formosus]
MTEPPKAPAAWSKAYPDASFEVVHSGNYLDWIGGGVRTNKPKL